MVALTTKDPASSGLVCRQVMVATSPGIRSLKYISQFLSVDRVVSPAELEPSDHVLAVVVWGRKDNARSAIRFAKANNLELKFLEDGWVRSCAENPHNRSAYSILIDDVGVYYDASKPSKIENLLNLSDSEFASVCTPAQLEYAADCRAMMVQSDITKYNFCKAAALPEAGRGYDKPLVMVVDQTFDDASVKLGGMDQSMFHEMLDAAIRENPDAEVVVRTHPDVVAGKRKGYLSDRASSLGVSVSTSGDNPITWLKRCNHVYVGTSQMGYEALLCESKVTVFGAPFYAGWGLTDDRNTTSLAFERRAQSRSIDEMFHVAHVLMAKYVSPITGEKWDLRTCLEHVNLQKQHFKKNANHYVCVGITAWKQRYVRQYLRSPDGSVSFHTKAKSFKLSGNKPLAVKKPIYTTWSFRHFSQDGEWSKQNPSRSVARIEDGFLRSAGLGSDFTAPGSLVVDHSGLYFDPIGPSDLENLLNTMDLSPADIQRAVKLRSQILNAGLSKYNIGDKAQKFAKAAVKKCVLVVGQVEDDASIQRGCSDVANNSALLDAVRHAEPDAYIVYKPHPDVVAGNRSGAVDNVLSWADEVNTHSSIAAGLDWCHELHTMTSLAGFEALMRNKSVVTYGMPFYAGWGLTKDLQSCARRIRNRTLDEVVYMTLIEYPKYLDIESGEYVTPETMVARLQEQRSDATAPNDWVHRQMIKVVNIVKGCQYAP